MWASAFLLARSGALPQSYSILRTAMAAPAAVELAGEWVDHYPVGRWRGAVGARLPAPFLRPRRRGDRAEQDPRGPRLRDHARGVGLRPEGGLAGPGVRADAAHRADREAVAKPLGLPGSADALKRPEVNIALGCRYLSQLRGQFSDNPLLAIPAYNAGAARRSDGSRSAPRRRFDLWVERIPYEETRLYTKRVMTSLAVYELLYAGAQPGEAPRDAAPREPGRALGRGERRALDTRAGGACSQAPAEAARERRRKPQAKSRRGFGERAAVKLW